MTDRPLHTVAETDAYLARCRPLGLTAERRAGIVDHVAADPSDGDVVRGSGGVRKVRYGSSSGYRVMVAYLGAAVPVGTLRQWETRRRQPRGAALVLLTLLERNPRLVEDTPGSRP